MNLLISLLGLMIVAGISRSTSAAPNCSAEFEQALARQGIKRQSKVVFRDAKEIKGRIDAYRAQRNQVVTGLLKSLGVAAQEMGPPTPPTEKTEEATRRYRRELYEYEQIQRGEPAYRAAQKDPRYIQATEAESKLRKDNQFDEINEYLMRERTYDRVHLIGSDSNPDAVAYVSNDTIVAYRTKMKEEGQQALTLLDPKTCKAKEIMVEQRKPSVTSWTYLSDKFCDSGPTLKRLAADLDPKEQEYENICRYQGGQPPGCRCSNGRYINPWAESCFAQRLLTAKDKLYNFIKSTGAMVWESKEGVEKGLQLCKVHGLGAQAPGDTPLSDGPDPSSAK